MKRKPLKLKGIKRVKMVLADGSIGEYLYHRATGKRLDESDLVQSYAAAEKTLRTKSRGTFSDLIRLWNTNNPVFDALSEATREAYPWKLKKLEAKWGGVPIDAFNNADDADAFAADALAWHLVLGKKSRRSADNIMSALCRVLSFAKEMRKIKFHPLPTFKRLYKSDRSEMTWSDGLIGRFKELADSPMRTAMYLARNTGQRQKDLRELPWSAYDGANIRLKPSKTSKHGTYIDMPCPIELKRYLDGLPRVSPLILTTVTGRGFKKRHFNDCWREVADKCGAGELNFHDLRGTAATQLAEAGATVSMIATLMGWTEASASKIIATYVARTSGLAKAGIELLEAHRAKKATPGTNQHS